MTPLVLIVDSTARSLAATREIIETAGYRVQTAAIPQEVDAALREKHFSLAIIEPVVPGLDGFELCRSLKKRSSSAGGPFVILASRIFRGARFKKMSRESGADAFLERPQEDHLLLATVRKLLPIENVPAAPSPSQHASAPVPTVAPGVLAEPAPIPASPVPAASKMVSIDDIEIEADSEVLQSDAPLPAPAHREPRPAPVAAAAAIPVVDEEDPSEEMSGITDISDDDIDGALLWALPGEASGEIAPSGPVSATRGAASDDGFLSELRALPIDFGLSGPASAPIDRETGAAAERALAGTLFPDDAVPDLASMPASAPPSSRVLASATAFGEPTAHSGPTPDFSSDVDLDLLKRPGTTPERPTSKPAAAPVLAARAVPELDLPLDLDAADTGYSGPRLEPPVVTPAAARTPTPAGGDAPPAAPVRQAQAIDDLLDRAFAGFAAAESLPADEASQLANALKARAPAPTTDAAVAVPDGLRGMDASTADLLSTLAELEDSIPSGRVGTDGGHGWAPARDGAHVEEGRPIPPPPRPDDELTLEEIFSRIGDQEPNRDGGKRTAAVHDAAAILEEIEAAPLLAPAPDARERPAKRWFMASVAAAVIVIGGGGGLAMFLRSGVEREIAAVKEPVLPVSDAIAASSSRSAAPASSSSSSTSAASTPGSGTAREAGTSALATLRPPLDRAREPEQPRAADSASPRDSLGATTGTAPTAASRIARAADTVPVAESPSSESAPSDDAPAIRRPAPTAAAEVLRRARGLDEGATDASGPESGAAAPSATPAQLALESPGNTAPPASPIPEPNIGNGPLHLVRLGDLDAPLERLEAPLPVLTEEADAAGVRERAFVNVLVGPNGEVLDARIMMDPGHGLGEAARRAALTWKYSAPIYRGGRAQVWKTEPIEFLKRTN